MADDVTTTSPDWGAEATDRFVDLIDNVKTKTTGPLLKVLRALVYGIVAGVMAIMVLFLVVIGLIRFVNAYLPGDVWAAYLLLGSIFLIAGLFTWTKRTA